MEKLFKKRTIKFVAKLKEKNWKKQINILGSRVALPNLSIFLNKIQLKTII